MKNYYELLEVDKNASPEIIEKAYKILVKKYHPDLQQNVTDKKFAEEQIKLINEAYDTLSDKNKKENYDANLQNNYISQEQYNILINENIKLKKQLNVLEEKLNINYTNLNNETHNNYNSSYTTYKNNSTNNNNIYNENYYPNDNTPNAKDYFLYNLKQLSIRLFKLILALLLIGLAIFILFKLPFFNNLIQGKNFLFFIALIIGFIYFYKNSG